MDHDILYFWFSFKAQGKPLADIPMDHGDFRSRLVYLLNKSLYIVPGDSQLRESVEIELGFVFIQAWTQFVRQDALQNPKTVLRKAEELTEGIRNILENVDEKQLFTYPVQPGFQERLLYMSSVLWILEKPQFKTLRDHFLPREIQKVLEDSGFANQFETLIAKPHLKTASRVCSLQGSLRHLAEYLQKHYPIPSELNQLLFRSLDRLNEIELERHPNHPGLEFDFSSVPSVTEAVRLHGNETVEPSKESGSPARSPSGRQIPVNTVPDWGRELVIIAKLLPVWLQQLSTKYQRNISRLDEIPDEELSELKGLHITGLWLVGIWTRSPASKQIKQALGNPHALASAYSICDYRVDPDLGGAEALKTLKEKARKLGIQLGADVIPNHTAIDSQWIQQHPEWFISSSTSPFPSYSFSGRNLSGSEQLDIRIEDHYYDRQDAAVVFRYQNRLLSDTPLYIYHGNDGTHVPWNDTAQLNYLNPQVRRKMIETIIEVSRDFPLIRLDAAMTLTRLHYKRLWFPPPGEGGAIPSRSGKIASNEEFDRLYGELEFWQEVLAALHRENPNALLLAEAFWLMEPYFINQIGMHKVYHSAFMNILRDYQGHKFNEYLEHLFRQHPRSTLNHYVNFLSTPDEAPAAVSFGKGDRSHAASILLSTFPGTPLFAHSQWDGLEEQYGMEFAAPMNNLPSDQGFYDYQKSVLLPLLSKRNLFSDAEHFRLCPFRNFDEDQNRNIICYANRRDGLNVYVIVNYQDCAIRGKVIDPESGLGGFAPVQILVQGHNTSFDKTPFSEISLGPWGFCVFTVAAE